MMHRGTQTIYTDRLVLRRIKPGDGKEIFFNWANDAVVTQYLTWLPHKDVAESKSVAQAWSHEYSRLDFYLWGIEIGGNLIGTISAHNINELMRSVEVGYAIGRAWWGQGIMTEALTAVIDYLFQTGFNRIAAFHHLDNPASGRVMQKSGMTFEGTLRQYAMDNRGTIIDVRLYSIVASDRTGRP
ncbi:MAG: GNAT family N-acetyltransferase [Coriobacteriia bacterium]|nr:GNAT family N-acetyltransferase [Coriobacteriia bacterium]